MTVTGEGCQPLSDLGWKKRKINSWESVVYPKKIKKNKKISRLSPRLNNSITNFLKMKNILDLKM